MLQMGPRSIVDDAMELRQGKTGKRLHILLTDAGTGERTQLEQLVDRLLQRKIVATRFVVNERHKGIRIGALRDRFNDARAAAAMTARAHGDAELAARIRRMWFTDNRPKAASDIEDIKAASKLLGHSEEEITRKVYRRVGERAKPTR